MYFFFHVLAGAVIGLLMADILRDRRWIPLVLFGSVLPDLIDKPLGMVILSDSIGYGRIFTHTLLAAIILSAVGFAVWQWKRSPVVLGVAVGVFAHQVLDLMWRRPDAWLFPLFGPFHGSNDAADFVRLTLHDLLNPVEILVALLLFTGLVLWVEQDRIKRWFSGHATMRSACATIASLGLIAMTAILLYAAVLVQAGGRKAIPVWARWMGWLYYGEFIIAAAVCLLAAYLAWRWRRKTS
jgi:membrane-bound metal-dependent hydrolase YbcI (DUF457 family)